MEISENLSTFSRSDDLIGTLWTLRDREICEVVSSVPDSFKIEEMPGYKEAAEKGNAVLLAVIWNNGRHIPDEYGWDYKDVILGAPNNDPDPYYKPTTVKEINNIEYSVDLLCPICETYPLAEKDYLCSGCRYGTTNQESASA